MGFPERADCASLRDAHRNLDYRHAKDRRRLEAITRDRNSPQKHVWRSQIILMTAAGAGTHEIMRETAKTKTCVWRWQERFMTEGVNGLVRDKTRPSRIPPLDRAKIDRVLELTNTAPLHEATHWTAAAMARATDVSVSSVKRIWKAHGLQPHRVRLFFRTIQNLRKNSRHCRAPYGPSRPRRGSERRRKKSDPGP